MHQPRLVARNLTDLSNYVPIDAEKILAQLKPLSVGHDVRAVWIGGSNVDGYGNARSDIDLYALVGGDAPTDRRGFDVFFSDSNTVQVHFVETRLVEKYIQWLGATDFEDLSIGPDQVQLLHRIVRSVPLSGGVQLQNYRESLLSEGFLAFAAFSKLCESFNSLQDLYGAWESNHLDTAAYNARDTARRALEAVLALLGESAINDKWVFAKSTRALGAESELRRRFRALYSSAPIDGSKAEVDSYIANALQVVRFSEEIVSAEYLFPGTPPAPGTLSPLSSTLLTKGRFQTRKSVHVFLRCVRKRPVLYLRGLPHSELGRRGAIIWLLLSVHDDLDKLLDEAHALQPELGLNSTEGCDIAAQLLARWVKAEMISG